MWSPIKAVIEWAAPLLDCRVSTYPPAGERGDFVVVNRVGGSTAYPHDSPRIALQAWTDSDANGEQVAFAIARVLPTLADSDPRINATGGEVVITQLGCDEDGHFVWQVAFDMECNIRED